MSHVCSAAIRRVDAKNESASIIMSMADTLTQELLCKKIGFIMKRDLIYVLESRDFNQANAVCIAYSKSALERKVGKTMFEHDAMLHVTEIQNRPFVLEKLASCSDKDFERNIQIYMDSLFMHWLLNKAMLLCMLVIVGVLFYLAKIYHTHSF